MVTNNKYYVKKFGEVFTPFKLVNEMLDTLPEEVWSNPNFKWADLCNGMGNFMIVVVQRLMNGLRQWEKNEAKRYKHILENMIYVGELQAKNMFLWMLSVDPKSKLKLNIYTGDTLSEEFDKFMKEEWKIEKFDIIVGNPPYQELKEGNKKSQSIWNLFVKKYNSLLNDNGYIVMVHPSGWRSLDGIYKDIQIMLKGNLIFLSMNDEKEGQNTFNATTSFDWYCYSKNKISKTKIKDQEGKIFEINLSNWEFIPNGEFDLFQKLIAINENKVNILHSYSAYETRKSWLSKNKSSEFKFPCIYTIVKNGTMNLYWSNTNENGHFNIPKVIWSNGMASQPTIDKNGDYGLTQFAYAIVDDINNLDNIKKCMDSEKFIKTMKLCYMSSGNRFDKKVLSTFRKDFWKEFIDENEN